jgi:DNA-binding FadR family transcriptional regulator
MPIDMMMPRRLYRQVADQLRQLIDAGEFAVGARLPTERELALQLGISRPTVREALIALEVDGRVRIRVGSGIYVLPPMQPGATRKPAQQAIPGPFELLNARALFESAVAEEAAGLATPDNLAPVDAALTQMRCAEHPGPLSMSLDRTFHTAVAGILGNDAVINVVGDLFDQRLNPYFAQLASYFENADSWSAALAEHDVIRDRLAANDQPGARAAMRTHLQNSQERFSRSFGEVRPAAPNGTAPRARRQELAPAKSAIV